VGPIFSTTDADVQIADYDTDAGAPENHFDGKIYWLAYWNRKLTDDEVNALESNGVKPQDIPGCTFLIDFHRPPGTTYESDIPASGQMVFDVEGTPTQVDSVEPSYGHAAPEEGWWDFNGTDAALRIPGTDAQARDFSPPINNDDFTVMGVAETDTIAVTAGALLAKYNDNGVNDRCWMVYRYTDHIRFMISKNGTNTTEDVDFSYLERTSCLTAGTRFFFCARYEFDTDGTSDLFLDVDGTEVSQTDAVGPVYNSTNADVQIGDWDSSINRLFEGKIFWLAYWNRKLTDDEKTNVRTGKIKPYDVEGLVYYQDFHKNVGTTYKSEVPARHWEKYTFDVEGTPTHGGAGTPSFDMSPRFYTIKEHPQVSRGLIAYYKFDDDDALDATILGHDGTLIGAPPAVSGRIKECYDFNGTDEYVDVGTDPAFETKHITVAAWVAHDVTTGTQNIISKRSAASPHLQWALQTDGAGKWQFNTRTSGGDNAATSTTDVQPGSGGWTLLVGTYDGIRTRIYVDGILEAEDDTNPGDLNNITNLPTYIGARATGTDPYSGYADPMNGKIDEVAIWDRALTAEEVFYLVTASPRRYEDYVYDSADLITRDHGRYPGDDFPLFMTGGVDGSTRTDMPYDFHRFLRGTADIFAPVHGNILASATWWVFDGTNAALRLLGTDPRAADFDPSLNNDDFTIAGLFLQDSATVSMHNPGLFGKYNANAVDRRCWALSPSRENGTTQLGFYVSKNGLGGAGTSSASISGLALDTPLFFCGRYEYNGDGDANTKVTLRVDSTEVVTANAVGPINTDTGADVQIADLDATYDRFLNGKIYWLAYWNRKLTDDEVAEVQLTNNPLIVDGCVMFIDFRRDHVGITEYTTERGGYVFDIEGSPTRGGDAAPVGARQVPTIWEAGPATLVQAPYDWHKFLRGTANLIKRR
jgi:hypothetical protein